VERRELNEIIPCMENRLPTTGRQKQMTSGEEFVIDKFGSAAWANGAWAGGRQEEGAEQAESMSNGAVFKSSGSAFMKRLTEGPRVNSRHQK